MFFIAQNHLSTDIFYLKNRVIKHTFSLLKQTLLNDIS